MKQPLVLQHFLLIIRMIPICLFALGTKENPISFIKKNIESKVKNAIIKKVHKIAF